jgi:TetR/AcrR family transcriptional regulator, mexJK operon transcriptional repressor
VGAARPRRMPEDERRLKLIAAASELFLHRGYHTTTMDDVARYARMSKKTLYQVFSAKSELFDALLTDWLATFTIPVESDGRSPRDVLTEVLSRLVNFALAERQVLMTRLLIAETSHSEEIAAALHRQGLGRGKGALEQWLAAQAAHGLLKVDDPDEVSSMLFFTAVGDFLMGLLLRTRARPTADEVNSRVARTVATFFQQFS